MHIRHTHTIASIFRTCFVYVSISLFSLFSPFPNQRLDAMPEFFYRECDFPAINLSEILKKSKSEEMFQFLDVCAGGGYYNNQYIYNYVS